MTAAATMTRHRRRGVHDLRDIPAGVASWFAGAAPFDAAGWFALLPDERPRLLAWWGAYKAENPAAAPPADASWIDWSAAA